MSEINMSRFFVGVVGECRIVMPNDPGEHLSSDKHVITEKPWAAKLEAGLQRYQASRCTFKLVFSSPWRGGEFKEARFEAPLKTLTHTQWLRDAEHKGQALTRPRVWKGQNLCAIWKRGSVIPACQYDFIRSFSSQFQPPNIVCWIIDRGRVVAGLWPSPSYQSRKKEESALGRRTESPGTSPTPSPVWGQSPRRFECTLTRTEATDSIRVDLSWNQSELSAWIRLRDDPGLRVLQGGASECCYQRCITCGFLLLTWQWKQTCCMMFRMCITPFPLYLMLLVLLISILMSPSTGL